MYDVKFYFIRKNLSYRFKQIVKVKVKSLSRVRLFATPWTVAYQVPSSMGSSRQEYWSGLLFLSPGDLPNPGIEPGSPAFQADALTSEPPGSKSPSHMWRIRLGIHEGYFQVLSSWPLFHIASEYFGAVVENLPANAGDARDMGSVHGSGRSLAVGNATHSSIPA